MTYKTPDVDTMNLLYFSFIAILCSSCVTGTKKDCVDSSDIFESINDAFVEAPTCTDSNWLVPVYEDCPTDTEIFTFTDAVTVRKCTDLNIDGRIVKFKSAQDAEMDDEFICLNLTSLNGQTFSFKFSILDVNEYQPLPDDISLVQTVNVMEDASKNTELLKFKYTDSDEGEISTIRAEEISGFDGQFEIVNSNNGNFVLKTIKEFDYEDVDNYNLKVKFTTSDPRGTETSIEQTFIVFVDDVGDTEPFWTTSKPYFELFEGPKSDNVLFKLKARDGDVGVNNDITYSLNPGDNSNLFSIDSTTGEVKQVEDIDREALSSVIINLEFTATESQSNVDVPPTPNSISQITSITIKDVNDNIPTFKTGDTQLNMDELTNQDGEAFSFTVIDMDEGNSGSFCLSVDIPNAFDISKDCLQGDATFNIIPRYESGIFDKEKTSDDLVKFTLTVTEKEDASHTDTLDITIDLNDVNDNDPIFDSGDQSVDINEDSPSSNVIAHFTATDADFTDQFNTKSIRYSLGSTQECMCVDIDPMTAVVTPQDMCLNYESDPVIKCNVIARDEEGNSMHQGMYSLTINLKDVDDTPPIFKNPDPTVRVDENTDAGTEILSFTVEDPDTDADIVFTIEYSDDIDEKIKEWFVIEAVSAKASTSNITQSRKKNEYVANLKIGTTTTPDREVLNDPDIVVTIKAEDIHTALNDPFDTHELTITINDLIDTAPVLTSGTDLEIRENNTDIVTIDTLRANDPDEGDSVKFILRKQSDFVDLDETTGALTTKKDVVIDYETDHAFVVQVDLVDTANLKTEYEINVNVIDINDESPVLNETLCSGFEVSEDTANNTVVGRVFATDADSGTNQEIVYELGNDKISTGNNLRTPFTLLPTGDIQVLTGTFSNAIKKLDREDEEMWILKIEAYDKCEPNQMGCTIHRDLCEIPVKILDINDNKAENFKITKNSQSVSSINIYESITPGNGELAQYEINAIDIDEVNTANSNLTFSLVYFKNLTDNEIIDMPFVIETRPRLGSIGDIYEYYSVLSLKDGVDFTGQRGDFELRVEATDHGENPMSGHGDLSVIIEDANDQYPEFVYEECVVNQNYVIDVDENWFVNDGKLHCTGIHDDLVSIRISDEDLDVNAEHDPIRVKYSESSVVPDSPDNQLHLFEVENNNDIAYLKISDKLDRTKGAEYNLVLYVQDKGTPPLSTTSDIKIIVRSAGLHAPVFCPDGEIPCSSSINVTENSLEDKVFLSATDADHVVVDDPDDILYYIVPDNDLDSDKFVILNNSNPVITPKSSFDRELSDNAQVLVFTSNSANPTLPSDHTGPSFLKINVSILDVNDNEPKFLNEIFGSFLVDGGKPDNIVVDNLKAKDSDIIDTLTYYLDNDFEWSVSDISNKEPFRIDPHPDDPRAAQIKLNFDPPLSAEGYCTFTVYVDDGSTAHEDGNQTVTVYAVTDDFLVDLTFANTEATIRANIEGIEKSFSTVYKFRTYVDRVMVKDNDASLNKTVAQTHFIEMDTYDLVDKGVIEEMGVSGPLNLQLQEQLSFYGLNLIQIGENNIGGGGNNPDDKITVYQISLAVVGGVLGALVVLLIIIYVAKTRNLQRKIKVLSTTSDITTKASNLNPNEDPTMVPGSNRFIGDGANPIFGEDNLGMRNDDNSSLSSGDSVLVGVEDNPEFMNYNVKLGNSAYASETAMNKSIDDVTGSMSPFEKGSTVNPLANLSQNELNDVTPTDTPSPDVTDDNFMFGGTDETLF